MKRQVYSHCCWEVKFVCNGGYRCRDCKGSDEAREELTRGRESECGKFEVLSRQQDFITDIKLNVTIMFVIIRHLCYLYSDEVLFNRFNDVGDVLGLLGYFGIVRGVYDSIPGVYFLSEENV